MTISYSVTSSYSQSSEHNMFESKAAAFYRDFTFDSSNHCKIPTQLDKMQQIRAENFPSMKYTFSSLCVNEINKHSCLFTAFFFFPHLQLWCSAYLILRLEYTDEQLRTSPSIYIFLNFELANALEVIRRRMTCACYHIFQAKKRLF